MGMAVVHGGISILAKQTMQATKETMTRMKGRSGASSHRAARVAAIMRNIFTALLVGWWLHAG
jgi:hypothetical protein